MRGRSVVVETSDWPYGTLLSRLSPDARAHLLALGVKRRARSEEVLLRQGACESHVILLLSGFAKVTVDTPHGSGALLAIRVAGDLVGEMSALNRRPRSASVITCTSSTVSVIHHPELQDFLIRRPDAALELAGMVADRLRWANTVRVDFAAYPAHVRLARMLVKVALTYGRRAPGGLVIGVALTQLELATLCGAAEVTVQKALRAFKHAGLIVTGYRHLTVTDLPGLRAVARLDEDGHAISQI